MAGACCAQEEKPPDYASKPLAKWIEALKDKDNPELRMEARQALGPTGPYAKVAVPALIDALRHTEPPLAWDTAQTLADYGPSVVPSLLRALRRRPEASVRAGVAEALGYVRPKAPEAVPALIEATKDAVADVRAAAVYGLGSIRSPADKIFPVLVSALGDKADRVREEAAAALLMTGRKAEPAIPALILALKDKSVLVRKLAAQTLWKIGPRAKAAIPGLIEGLRDTKNAGARWAFAQALGGIGPGAKDAVPSLAEVLRERDDGLRRWAMSALGQIGPPAKAAVPALIAAAMDKSNKDRCDAMCALGKIGPDARAAVPLLIEELAIREPLEYRRIAAEALGGIGPGAKAAVSALTDIARDRFAYAPARKAAAEAVMKIDPEFAARKGVEFAYLNVRLGNVPSVKIAPRARVSEERKREVKELIADLAEMEDPDFGTSKTLDSCALELLAEQGHPKAGLATGQRPKSAATLRRLIELGPEALPFLLDALGDATPTRLGIEPTSLRGFGTELARAGNPLNPLERRVLSKEAANDEDEDHDPDGPYLLKVSDVCLLAIGQIVGRPYGAVRFPQTSILFLNSLLDSKEFHDRVRVIWQSNNPSQKLLDSLLLDYATEGVFNGQSLDGWSDGSEFQVEAAMRLLYYFPKETAPLIAARLRSLEVRLVGESEWMKRDVMNGVRTTEFIRAVSWCTAPPIKEALADIIKRTNDPHIKAAAERRPVNSGAN
jgi:HEAT repeat protein